MSSLLTHLVFIESSCPAFLSKYTDGDIFIYTKKSCKYSIPGQRILVVSVSLMRYVKLVCALLRLPCTFSDGFGVACRLSKNKSVISDGILTELLYRQGYIKPRKFISITNIEPVLEVNHGMQLILGNNFFEFGIFSYSRNEEYLRILNESYPNAYYYPHPKEGREILQKIFGPRLIRSSDNIETFCMKNGIPGHLIGILGSTATTTLGKLTRSSITIDAIKINDKDCDGAQGEITDPFLLKKMGIKVTMTALEEVAKDILKDVDTVTIREQTITFSKQ